MLDYAGFDKFCTDFNLDILDVIKDNNWDAHYQKIQDLKTFARSVIANGLNDIEAQDLGYLLGHAAWAVGAKLRAKDDNEAFDLIALGRLCIRDAENQHPLTGYLQYIESTVHRGVGHFRPASIAAKAAVAAFKTAPGEVTLDGRQHALNQDALALMRAKRLNAAEGVLFTQMKKLLSEAPVEAEAKETGHFDASQLISLAEGPAEIRTHKNTARFYLEQNKLEDALTHASLAVDFFDPFERPIDRAYDLTIRAECYSKMSQPGAAFNDLKAASGIYQKAYPKAPHINAFRTLTLLAQAAADLGRPNVFYLKQARAMQKVLKLEEDHDYLKALKAVPEKGTMADEHYVLAGDLLRRSSMTMFTPYKNKNHHVSALLNPLCFIAKALMSVARVLIALIESSGSDALTELGAAGLNALNAVASTLSLVTRTLSSVFALSYLDNKPGLDNANVADKIKAFEFGQNEDEAHQSTMALGA